MGFISQSLTAVVVLLGSAPSTFARTFPRHTFIPRQATPGFSGCSYPPGWTMCNDVGSRDCWVRDPSGKEYNINTDYETDTPTGIERTYDIEITEESISPDGVAKPLAKLINGKYPGQTIEACWGDTLIVNVKNSLPDNGTTIHWHGIRQLGSNEMDGVNGVTQCPTAQDDTFTYKFKLTQYGHTWYHSHYSNQYPDGVAAPLLIHGPNSHDWDVEWEPIIITDWLHKSAFELFHLELTGPPLPVADSILVNGTGQYNGTGGSLFQQKFEAGKRYLIRLINGSAGTHFVFSIDNHNLTVISTDLVPIVPYNVSSLSIGIGQRYSIIVEAKPDTPSSNNKYWLRTEFSTTCNNGVVGASTQDLQRTGIISYGNSTGTDNPTSTRHSGINVACDDESQINTVQPVYKWDVTAPQNNITENTYAAGLQIGPQFHGFNRWNILDNEPLWLNFSDPTILNLNNETFNPEYATVPYNYTNGNGFVYMIIEGGGGPLGKIAATHPIHLHGHDFAIIGQSTSPYNINSPPQFNLDNPPRRDVAMLPANGYLAIAFKPDNPGIWLLHCHIAWHAASGLALQVIERQNEIAGSIGSLNQQQQGCQKWDSWVSTHPNEWKPADQEDSGI